MKKIQYLIFIGMFVILAGMVASAYAIDEGAAANYISILKKQPKNHDGGSGGEPGDRGDQGDPGTVEDPTDDDPPVEEASVDIRPNTINLKRHGIFTAIINLPETTDMALFDPNSIILFVDPNIAPGPGKDDKDKEDSAIAALAPPAYASFTPMTTVAPIKVFETLSNTVVAKFSNKDIIGLIETDIPDIMDQVPAMVTFWVQWKLDNTVYEASDAVRVINPGKGSTGKGKGKGGGAE